MLFYFSATGNSLYAAKQIEENPISIPQVIHQETLHFRADKIGIVCPVYGHEAPGMVKDFLRRATFETDYFYMVLTYGNRHGGAAELAHNLCRECGIAPQYINVLLMVDNWLPSFDMDEQKKLDKKVDEHIAQIVSDIHNGKEMIAEVTDTDRAAHQEFLSRVGRPFTSSGGRTVPPFQVTEACTGCGICTKVCPVGIIEVKSGHAVHNGIGCQMCLACVQNCPQKAIKLTMPEKNPNARYRNEHIALNEIIAANNQQK